MRAPRTSLDVDLDTDDDSQSHAAESQSFDDGVYPIPDSGSEGGEHSLKYPGGEGPGGRGGNEPPLNGLSTLHHPPGEPSGRPGGGFLVGGSREPPGRGEMWTVDCTMT